MKIGPILDYVDHEIQQPALAGLTSLQRILIRSIILEALWDANLAEFREGASAV